MTDNLITLQEEAIVKELGIQGPPGRGAYVYIKWSAAEPTADGDMKDAVDAWIGICSTNSATAPTAYTAYAWQNIGNAADYAKEIDGQTELTTLSDADEIPVYDAANTVQKKTLWSTVKTALAALFVSKDTSGNVLVAGKQVKNAILENVTTLIFSGATAGLIQFYYPTAEPFGRVLLYGRGGSLRFLSDSTEVAQKTVGSILFNYQNNGGAL